MIWYVTSHNTFQVNVDLTVLNRRKYRVWNIITSPGTTQELTTRKPRPHGFKSLFWQICSIYTTRYFFFLLFLKCSAQPNNSTACCCGTAYLSTYFLKTWWEAKMLWLNSVVHALNTDWTHGYTHIPLKIKGELRPCSAAFSFVSSIRCSSLWRASCSCRSSFSASNFIPEKEFNTNNYRYPGIWNEWTVQRLSLV